MRQAGHICPLCICGPSYFRGNVSDKMTQKEVYLELLKHCDLCLSLCFLVLLDSVHQVMVHLKTWKDIFSKDKKQFMDSKAYCVKKTTENPQIYWLLWEGHVCPLYFHSIYLIIETEIITIYYCSIVTPCTFPVNFFTCIYKTVSNNGTFEILAQTCSTTVTYHGEKSTLFAE